MGSFLRIRAAAPMRDPAPGSGGAGVRGGGGAGRGGLGDRGHRMGTGRAAGGSSGAGCTAGPARPAPVAGDGSTVELSGERCYFHAGKPRLAGRICVLICGQRLVCVLVTTPSPPGPKRRKRWPWVVLAGVLALAGAVWFGASWLPLHVRDGVRHDLVFAGGRFSSLPTCSGRPPSALADGSGASLVQVSGDRS